MKCLLFWLNFLGCEVYNLGTGKGTSVLEMVKAFEEASGKVTKMMILFLSSVVSFVIHCCQFFGYL